MDYRIDPDAEQMRTALLEFLQGRLPDPGSEPDENARASAWRELTASEWLEHYVTTLDATPAERVAGVHVAEAFGAAPVTGPVDVVAGYVLPLATALDWAPPLDELRRGVVVTAAALPVLEVPTADAVPRRSSPRLPMGRDLRLSGSVRGVVGAASASSVLLPISVEGEPALALVALDRAGVTVGPPSGADLRAPVADVTVDGLALDPQAVRTGVDVLDHEHRAAVAHSLFLDADAVGGASEVIARTVRYCRERSQFGRPIGSFQAIRHRIADASAKVEGARSLLHRSAWGLAAGTAGAEADVVAGRLWSAAAYVSAVQAAVQCHGGMGFTWEQGVHVFYRAALAGRARSAEARSRAALAAHLRSLSADAASPDPTPDGSSSADPELTLVQGGVR